MISIDYVIEECRQDFKIEESEKHKPFLERYITQTPKPKQATEKAYVQLLEDALLMFSYLTRERTTTENGQEIKINSEKRLKLLCPAGMQACVWQDTRAGQLYARREYARKKGLPSYKDLINIIGKDEEVRKVWKREIKYDDVLKGHYWKKRFTKVRSGPAIPTGRTRNYRQS